MGGQRANVSVYSHTQQCAVTVERGETDTECAHAHTHSLSSLCEITSVWISNYVYGLTINIKKLTVLIGITSKR